MAAPCTFCNGQGHYEGGGSMWCDCPAGQAARQSATATHRQTPGARDPDKPCPFYAAALDTLEGSTPGLSQMMRESIARSIGLKCRQVVAGAARDIFAVRVTA